MKPIEIDDVAVRDRIALEPHCRRLHPTASGEQVEVALQGCPETARTEVVGGRRRQVRVLLDPERMSSRQVTALDGEPRARRRERECARAGVIRADNREVAVESGPFLRLDAGTRTLVVGVFAGKPVYLRDVAKFIDGPEEPTNYTRIGFGPGEGEHAPAGDFPAVTVGVAKRKGSNAVSVSQAIEAKVEELKADVIPHDVEVRITRNNGETAKEKVDELIRELGLAIIIVSALVMFALGWREALVVVTAGVPLTLP